MRKPHEDSSSLQEIQALDIDATVAEVEYAWKALSNEQKTTFDCEWLKQSAHQMLEWTRSC